MITASSAAPTDTNTLFLNRSRNSSRTVEISPIVSGESPSDRQPFQSGWKRPTHGMMSPCVTFTAVLKDVLIVQ